MQNTNYKYLFIYLLVVNFVTFFFFLDFFDWVWTLDTDNIAKLAEFGYK